MKKVNYKVLKITGISSFFGNASIDSEKLEEKLNTLGDQGWDLTDSIEINSYKGQSSEVVMILKKYDN